jgi:hypothetical protein
MQEYALTPVTIDTIHLLFNEYFSPPLTSVPGSVLPLLQGYSPFRLPFLPRATNFMVLATMTKSLSSSCYEITTLSFSMNIPLPL